MRAFTISVIMILCVIFIIILLSVLFKKKEKSIILNLKNDINSVEFELRKILRKYPDYVIIVSEFDNKDINHIINILAEEYTQIKIIKRTAP